MSLAEAWRSAVRRELDAAVELRHELHQHPRIGGDEADTARRVTEAIGLGAGRTIAGTGRLLPVAAGRSGRGAVLLRTELDGLPIAELTGVPWASPSGAMHPCGHDVHMAGLVAVARAAAHVDLPAPLVALLQPREEGFDSGALDVVAEGGLEGVDAVLAAHVQPQLPAGLVAVTPGPVNAGTDELTITVHGRGGHSGYPHTVDDSVLALSSVVVALQQVGARRIDPTVGVACMVNQLHAGTANNVVPASAVGSGTVRTMRPEDRQRAHQAIRDIAHHVAAAHGCTAEVRIDLGEPPLANDAELARRTAPVLASMGHRVSTDFRSFGSDDFSHYCAHARGLMMFLGTGAEHGGLHDATYLPDDGYVAVVADALVAGYCAAVGAA
ncbi:MAG: amidohydrolase [Nocardioidaceae bacterium]